MTEDEKLNRILEKLNNVLDRLSVLEEEVTKLHSLRPINKIYSDYACTHNISKYTRLHIVYSVLEKANTWLTVDAVRDLLKKKDYCATYGTIDDVWYSELRRKEVSIALTGLHSQGYAQKRKLTKVGRIEYRRVPGVTFCEPRTHRDINGHVYNLRMKVVEENLKQQNQTN